MTHYIEAPLVNVNDETATISRWGTPDGGLVHKGDVIAVLETTKATFDLESEWTGYLHSFAPEGAQVGVGEIIGAICDTAEETPARPVAASAESGEIATERKLTKKAEIAARKAGLNFESVRAEIAGAATITEADIHDYVRRHGTSAHPPGILEFRDTVEDVYTGNRQQRLLIVGGGMGAVQLLDSLSRIDTQRAVAIIDDNPELNGKSVMGVSVEGGQDRIEALFKKNVFDAAIVSVSTSIGFRERMSQKLSEMGIPGANVIDPTSRIQRNARLGTGNVILPYCHIGSCAIVGNGNFLSPYVDIEHHCTLGDFCTFGPGVMASGLVNISSRVKFGTGVFIEPKINIGADSIIGSGAIITRDIPENSVVKTRVNYAIRKRTP